MNVKTNHDVLMSTELRVLWNK